MLIRVLYGHALQSTFEPWPRWALGRFYFVCIRARPVGPRDRSPGRVGGVREVAQILLISDMSREGKGFMEVRVDVRRKRRVLDVATTAVYV